jgi:hypothetical protein
MPGFYPDRKLDMPHIERFTPVMKHRLRSAGARLAAMPHAAWQLAERVTSLSCLPHP